MRVSPSINRRSVASASLMSGAVGEWNVDADGGGGREGEEHKEGEAEEGQSDEEDQQQPGSRRVRTAHVQAAPRQSPQTSFTPPLQGVVLQHTQPTPSPPRSLSQFPALTSTPPGRGSLLSRTPRSSSSGARASAHRPPPLVLEHSASRSAERSAARATPTGPSAESLLLVESAEKQRTEERLVHIRRHHRFTRSFLHAASLVAFVAQQLLSIALIVLASLWKHTAGLAVGSASFALGLAGSIVWYYALLDSERAWVVCFVRPLWFASRVLLFCVLLVYVLLHALHPDPAWSPYPSGCPASASCARLGANATASLSFLPPATSADTLSDARSAVLSFVGMQDGWTVLDSNLYREHGGSGAAVVLVRVRALSTVLGVPSDIDFRIACNRWGLSEVWVQSASRLQLWDVDYGLNLRHVDDARTFIESRAQSSEGAGCG